MRPHPCTLQAGASSEAAAHERGMPPGMLIWRQRAGSHATAAAGAVRAPAAAMTGTPPVKSSEHIVRNLSCITCK